MTALQSAKEEVYRRCTDKGVHRVVIVHHLLLSFQVLLSVQQHEHSLQAVQHSRKAPTPVKEVEHGPEVDSRAKEEHCIFAGWVVAAGQQAQHELHQLTDILIRQRALPM